MGSQDRGSGVCRVSSVTTSATSDGPRRARRGAGRGGMGTVPKRLWSCRTGAGPSRKRRPGPEAEEQWEPQAVGRRQLARARLGAGPLRVGARRPAAGLGRGLVLLVCVRRRVVVVVALGLSMSSDYVRVLPLHRAIPAGGRQAVGATLRTIPRRTQVASRARSARRPARSRTNCLGVPHRTPALGAQTGRTAGSTHQ